MSVHVTPDRVVGALTGNKSWDRVCWNVYLASVRIKCQEFSSGPVVRTLRLPMPGAQV